MDNRVINLRSESGPALAGTDYDANFTRLYREAAPGVYAYLHRLCGCPYLAEDLLQETFLSVFRGLADFQGRSSPRTWVLAVATNKFRDHCRKRQGKVETGSERPEEMPASGPEPLAVVIEREECRQIREAILALSPELRTSLLLVRFEGLKYGEAAEVLGTTLATVRMQVHRAHRMLAQTLGEEAKDGQR